ncbi:uncharacterized protein LOC117224320 [Megalopta genalis]|uniref:uncharacterized protein LOC117224320 n=1 Tax=Megalopta genalis TaxID=115081 RepID=UPI0014433F86|nr:uncharacterized protein LOC117224320 [Megalopta genalis]
MEQSFNECIDQLRKRSRLLLARVEQDSKRVKEEYKKLYSQALASREDHCTGNRRSSCVKQNIKSWQLRNDSSGVGGALCLDYSTDSSDQSSASMPNLAVTRRVVISSKKHSESQHCLKNVHRKPVRECYCNHEVKKIQPRSTRTQRKPDPGCKYCKSHIEFKPAIVRDSPRRSLASPPISCETLRRVQRIDYAPKSQFLRNVQSKVCLLQSGDGPGTCTRSSCHRRDQPEAKKSQIETTLARSIDTSGEEQKTPKQSREHITKKTLTSKKPVPDSSKTKSSPKDSARCKSLAQSLGKVCHCCHNCQAHQRDKSIRSKNDIDSEDYQHTVCVSNLDQVGSNEKNISDNELRELRKFREQNYFDTHGSSHTLHSSKSSGSLEQYLLNDRLFPEPCKTIHKKDLVVTMPACATLQRKRIHYFPRYIVRQDKTNGNKKKRCQSCPLTGHAIDLGVTRMRPPLNSLALKYQKRLP